jgi:hypothetical protein
LFIFPIVPPVEPAWANAGASASHGASIPSDPTMASILDNFPISVTPKVSRRLYQACSEVAGAYSAPLAR